MNEVTLNEAQENLARIIADLGPGESVVISDQGKTLATVIKSDGRGVDASDTPRHRPKPGFCKGMIRSMADDFDAPLDDFREYME